MREQITNYIKAGYPGLYLVSYEEQRVEMELRAVAADTGFQLHVWSLTTGIVDPRGNELGYVSPEEMPDGFLKLPAKSILVCRDYHQFMGTPGQHCEINPMISRKLKDALIEAKQTNRVLIILGCRLMMAPELEKELVVVEFKLPTKEQLRPVLEGIATSAGITLNGQTEALLDAASGLTTIEAENAFALSVVEGKDILPAIVAREKAATVKKNGILEIVESKTGLADIGGLETLKTWLSRRSKAYGKDAQAYGLPVAKGMMAVGIPGTGKSLSAKATASILGVPLLKLDGGKLFGSLVGESERNLRAAIATAEAVAPCVLWVDEAEKAFSGSKSSGQTDGGTSSRVFGTFLQWLQEKTSPVFVFMTANDISQLPPEFLRKGRLDEVWFVDLPDAEERENIWRIQITKRGRKPDAYSITLLAELTDGFTGAEIEAVFTEALFSAFDESVEPGEKHLTLAINNTVPLSKMMATEVEALRKWAQGRARRASPVKAPDQKRVRKLATN